jgi:SAM-dependent methyltransferase
MAQVVEHGKPADYGQELLNRRARITSSFVSLKEKLVLDFGSGNGAQTFELLKQGCRIVACDINAATLAILTAHASTHNIDTVTALQYDGMKLPAPDRHFDAVVSYAVLEHVQNEEQALSEMHRVLKEQGILVISVPNKWWIFETHGARLPWLPWNRVPFFSWLPAPVHSRFAKARIYTKRGITGLLARNGFEVLGSGYITAPMDVVRVPALQGFLRRTIFRNDVTPFPMLSTEIIVHCRKAA